MLGELYLVGTKGDPGEDADSNWLKQFRASKCCSVCHERFSEFAGERVDVVLVDKPDNHPIQLVPGIPAELVSEEFLLSLQKFDKGYLVVGDVRQSSGAICSGFYTITTKRPLCTRGGRESTRRQCGGCQRLLYYPKPFGYEYIVKSDLVEEQWIYLLDTPSLVLTELVLDALSPSISAQLVLERIPVVVEPEDGILDFPVPFL